MTGLTVPSPAAAPRPVNLAPWRLAPAGAADLRQAPLGWHPLGVTFTLRDVARWTGGSLFDVPGDVALDRLITDSRQAGPGALFVALTGEAMDGHRFIPDAVAAGASALLCATAPAGLAVPRVLVPDTREALVGFSRGRVLDAGLKVVGVTGSAGKTTTKEMLAAVIARRHPVLKTEGNLNTYTGLPMTLARIEPAHEVFVAEYAMSALGEIAFLARMAAPDVAVVLNVGLAHVGLLGSVDRVAQAKRELVEGLRPDGVAVLNAADQRVAAMATAAPGRVVYYATDRSAGAAVEFYAEDISPRGLDGTTFTLCTPEGPAPVTLALPGMHSVSNAVAAAAVGHLMGVGVDESAAALSSIRPMSGRMSLRPGRMGATIIDDAYNASPGSMEASLQVLGGAAGATRVAVLGDMLELGEEAPRAHRLVGEAAAGSADLLVALGEHAGEVVKAARGAGMAMGDAIVAPDVDSVVAAVEPRLAGAVVLVKGSRGMALERVVDRLVAS